MDRKHGRSAGGALLLSLLALLAVSACRDPAAAAGTALYVTAEFDPLLQLTQLRVSGQVEGGGEVPGALLPERPGRILQSGETFRVLLPDAADGAPVTLRVEGLSGPHLAALGEARAEVREGYEVDVLVALVPQSEQPDSGTPDSGTPDSGTPDAGTFCLDCPDGCCQGGSCVDRAEETCGVGGEDCVACDPELADTCSSDGRCACGAGPACSSLSADSCVSGQCRCGRGNPCGPGLQCVGGQCRCGDGPVCSSGQACVDGQCRCTPDSCDGCCQGNSCQPGTHKDRCGRGGEACMDCKSQCLPNGQCR